MAIDFQQLRNQVIEIGNRTPARMERMAALREIAEGLFTDYSHQSEWLKNRVRQVVQNHNPNIRCAVPTSGAPGAGEFLNGRVPLPELPESGTVLAADGSQIMPDRHEQVFYALINLGTIRMHYHTGTAPAIAVQTMLYDDDQLYTDFGRISDARLALMRDLYERRILSEMASGAQRPVVSFTDGPMELWGARDGMDVADYRESLDSYLEVLENLRTQGVITAGYVDKPGANLVVRLLELASLDESDLPGVQRSYPLRGVSDFWLFKELLHPGERSAVFAIQSMSSGHYQGDLALHFFYLNVGLHGSPWIARVELPAWVVNQPGYLDILHAVLVDQCRILGVRPYPYLLHRAHEIALVTRKEKEQVTEMITHEMHRRGLVVTGPSQKQIHKNLSGRERF